MLQNQLRIAWLRRMTFGLVGLSILYGAAWAADAAGTKVVAQAPAGTTTLTKSEIADIFLGKKTTWNDADKTKIVFVVLDGGPAHEQFLKEYVNKTPAQYANYWKNQVFTGKGRPPQAFKTEGELLDYVAKNKGAIGYIGAGTHPEKVDVLEVK